MILLIYNQKMCREILLPNLRDSDYAISISGKAYGLYPTAFGDYGGYLENKSR